MKFQRALAAIVSILTLACFLRLWGSDYGIPHSVARPDEETVVQNALQMFADRDPNPRFFEYPTLSMYATALGFETAYRVGKLDHRYDEPFDFLFDNAVLRPGLAYRIARAVSLVFALGTVAATGWLGWEVSRRENVALISALLLSANFLHVAFSRFATVDVAMTFFITLALAFSVRAAKYQKWRDYLASGLAIGLAASAKYNAALVALGLLAAAVYGFREHRRKGALQLLSAALASIAAFAATSPYALLHPDEVRAGLEKHSYFFTHGPDPLGLSVHLGRTFPAGLGWPLYLASLIALGWVVLRRRREDVVLLLFLLPFFATIAGVRVVYPRYVLPMIPILVVLAADLGATLLRRWLLVSGVAVLVLPGILSSFRFDRLASRADTRLLASDWVNANVRRRSAIVVCHGYGAPEINSDRRRPPAFRPLRSACRPEDWTEEFPPFVITHEHPALTKYSSLDRESRAWLEARATKTVRFDPFVPGNSEEPLFYYSDAFYLPLAGFGAVERGGPIVTIWELSSHRYADEGNTGLGRRLPTRAIDVDRVVAAEELLFGNDEPKEVPTGRN